MDDKRAQEIFDLSMQMVGQIIPKDGETDPVALRDLKNLMSDRVMEAERSVLQLASNPDEGLKLATVAFTATLATMAAAAAKKLGMPINKMDTFTMASMGGLVMANILKNEEAKRRGKETAEELVG
jgi:hypothetical protein